MRDQNNSILNMLYRGTTTIQDFCWDNMYTVPILSLMTMEDIDYIRSLILSPRYSGNNRYKMSKIDEVMHRRGFTKYAGGTNRLVYIHPSAPNAVFKVAIDSVGIGDNPAEFRNQEFLKPYCTKVFECSPCGTIASFEKVDRITTFQEFYSIADDYFYLLSRVILGKYVMDDIGIDYFMNISVRPGFGVVLLDFPYLFELDGRKLECLNELDDGTICGGEIDYDDGFNKLVCKKCGRVYRAIDLAKPPESRSVLIRKKGEKRMNIELTSNGKVVKEINTDQERDYLVKEKEKKQIQYAKSLEVELVTTTEPVKESTNTKTFTDTGKVTVKNSPTPEKEPTKSVTKTIDVSLGDEEVKENETKEEVKSNSNVVVKITKTKIVNSPNKTKPVVVRKPEIKPLTETNKSKTKVLEKVINVELDETAKLGTVIKPKINKPSAFDVEVIEVEKKEVTEEEVKKVEEKVEEIKEEVKEKVEEVETKKEDAVEAVKEILNTVEEAVKEEVEAKKEEKKPINVVSFGDEEEEDNAKTVYQESEPFTAIDLIKGVFPDFPIPEEVEEPKKEEESKEEEQVEEEKVNVEADPVDPLFVGVVIKDDDETELEALEKKFPASEQVAGTYALCYSQQVDDEEDESKKYSITNEYMCMGNPLTWVKCTDNDLIKSTLEGDTEEEDDEDDDLTCDINSVKYVKVLPRRMEKKVMYCVILDPMMDIESIDTSIPVNDMKKDGFEFYALADNGVKVKMEFDEEDKSWSFNVCEEEKEDESDLEALKSQEAKSIEDILG